MRLFKYQFYARAITKLALFGAVCAVYGIHALTMSLLGQQNKLGQLVQLYSRMMIKVLGIKIKLSDDQANAQNQGLLLVSNHLSYLDVIIISSQYSSSFITSQEVKETFFLGHLCQLANCLFVERRNKQNLHQEISDLAQRLREGQSITIFPEGTSSNGAGVLRFRKPLFAAAIEAQAKILPITINYLKLNHYDDPSRAEMVQSDNRDLLCWYGDMDFLGHFWKLCQLKSVEVELSIHPLCDTYQYGKIERPEVLLAAHLHQQVSSSFKPLTETELA